jgi:hypothetical protein
VTLDLLLLAENLSNEERTWEEIMQIKAMPVSMMQKKEMKAKLQVGYVLILSFIMSTNK